MSTENDPPPTEPVAPVPPKATRTEAQQLAFQKAQAARNANVAARRQAQVEQHELARKIMEEKYGEKVATVLGPRGRGQPTREEQFLLAEAKDTLALVRDQVQQAKVVEVPVMPNATTTAKVLAKPVRENPTPAPVAAAAAPEPEPQPEPEEDTHEQDMDALTEMVFQRIQRTEAAKAIRKTSRRRKQESSSEESSSESDDEPRRDRRRRSHRRDEPKAPPPPPPSVQKPKRNIIFLS